MDKDLLFGMDDGFVVLGGRGGLFGAMGLTVSAKIRRARSGKVALIALKGFDIQVS